MVDDRLAPDAAREVRIEGRVQGVGFRWSAYEEARRCGVVGWVRNAPDGSVEVHAEGSAAAVEAFLSWLRQGPPGARVDSLRARPVQPTGTYRRFSIEQ